MAWYVRAVGRDHRQPAAPRRLKRESYRRVSHDGRWQGELDEKILKEVDLTILHVNSAYSHPNEGGQRLWTVWPPPTPPAHAWAAPVISIPASSSRTSTTSIRRAVADPHLVWDEQLVWLKVSQPMTFVLQTVNDSASGEE